MNNDTNTVVAYGDDVGGEANSNHHRNVASTSYFVQIGSEMVSRLELEATYSVIAGVFSLFVFPH